MSKLAKLNKWLSFNLVPSQVFLQPRKDQKGDSFSFTPLPRIGIKCTDELNMSINGRVLVNWSDLFTYLQ